MFQTTGKTVISVITCTTAVADLEIFRGGFRLRKFSITVRGGSRLYFLKGSSTLELQHQPSFKSKTKKKSYYLLLNNVVLISKAKYEVWPVEKS